MQKITVALLSLLLSAAGTLCAQDNDRPSPGDRLFNPPPQAIGINYQVQLGNGNILRIDLANGYDLRFFKNIDSLLMVFLNDMKAFRDSLTDPLTVKHIDYLIDTSGKKKLRIRQYRPAATSFLLDSSEPALLRIEQDTIRILLVSAAPGRAEGRTVKGLRYDRLCFFVNHYSELESCISSGLNDEIRSILSHTLIKPHPYRCPFCYIVRDSGVRTNVHDRNTLSITPAVAVQNYKNYFSPSFALGGSVNLLRRSGLYKFGAAWEPLFFFAPDAQGQLHTYRNDFVVLTYVHDRQASEGKNNPGRPRLNLDPDFTFGYLVRSQGDYFSKPAFRLTVGAGELLHGSLRIEPGLYFNNFFRGVTPCLRLSLGGF
ncbi:MAG TPA: hypothetical protein VG052_00425 [Puia sp.]|jgi:hypothetical protein|nr:hypothetical protein [Puia sp.]